MNGDSNSAQGPNTSEPNTPPNSVENGPHKNTLMAVLSYIGPLVIVSYLTAKNDAFVRFHIKQGLVLLILWVAVWFIGMALWMLWPLLQLINFAVAVLAIIGIVNAAQGKEKIIPVVGKFSHHFKI